MPKLVDLWLATLILEFMLSTTVLVSCGCSNTLRGFCYRNLSSHSSGGQKSGTEVSAELVPSEGYLLYLFLLCMSVSKFLPLRSRTPVILD